MANFKTLARTVDLLGKEQIRDEATAISELLRNSYDADAEIGLVDVKTQLDQILVWDDGCGMNESEIVNNWLTLGTYSKMGSVRRETKKGRIKIGEKGIGRLAISLLGNQVLLISKREKELDKENNVIVESTWNILYLHWGFFRNEKLNLDDINIPLKSFISYDEMCNFLKNSMSELKEALINNFQDYEKWEIDTYLKIKSEIEAFDLPNEVYLYLLRNEKKGKGTLFFIKNISEANYNWNIYNNSLNVAIKDKALVRKTRRMRDLIFSFKNVIDIIENENSKENNNDRIVLDDSFTPQIHIDGAELESETWLDSEQINLFDYALQGEIDNGKFTGKALFQEQDNTITTVNVVDLSLTTGLNIESIKNCGPIKIKWYYVEGEQYNTCLKKEQHDLILKKLKEFGGIYVYRDNLRILPYGAEDNDFLGIEYRRNLRAGDYLFSQRRMFGYIAIGKKSNPDLLDKSSREGFIENEYYEYFVGIASNLMIQWATEIIGTRHPRVGMRTIRKRAFEQRRMEEERRKREAEIEKRNQLIYLQMIDKWLENFSENIDKEYINIKQNVDTKIAEWVHIISTESIDSGDISKKLFDIKNIINNDIEKLESQKNNLNPRYILDAYKVAKIEENNEVVDDLKKNLIQYADESIDLLWEKIKDYSYNNDSQFMLQNPNIFLSISTQIEFALQWIDIVMKERISIIETDTINEIQKLITKSTSKVIDKIKEDIELKKIDVLKAEQNLLALSNQYRNINPKEFDVEQLSQLNKDVYKLYSEMRYAQNKILEYQNSVRYSEEIKAAKAKISNLTSDTDLQMYDDTLIGLLKREVEMYREVSAVGIAAELTSHEFNALYHGIQSDISVLNSALNGTKASKILERVSQSFVSLERLHQRMSPLYRKTRYIKKDIYIKRLIEDIKIYFKSDIKKYDIKVVCEIPENYYVKESETILFTPLVNLLSNSIFWLLDQKEKEIHIYLSYDKRQIFVHDTGPGISENDRAKIFDPFYSKKPEGRGLGLFLSRDILEFKGHELYLIDEEKKIKPYKGACFCIDLNIDTILGEN